MIKFQTVYGQGEFDICNRVINIEGNSIKLKERLIEGENRLYLKLSSKCNLMCSYCFQQEDLVHSNMFSFLDYQGILMNLSNSSYDRIFLFGGEPLISENVGFINLIFNIFTKNKLSIFTNGNFNEDLFNILKLHKENIDTVIITIDGPEEIHNFRRFNPNGNSYKIIMNNIKKLLTLVDMIDIQINIDKTNVFTINKLFDGFKEYPFLKECQFSINPVKYTSDSLSTIELYDLYFKLVKHYKEYCISLNSKTFINFIDFLGGKPIVKERCGIGHTHIFDFENNIIYACPQKMVSKVGDLNYNGYKLDHRKIDEYHNISMKNNSECQSCFYSLFCDQGCAFEPKKVNCKQRTCTLLTKILDNISLFFQIK